MIVVLQSRTFSYIIILLFIFLPLQVTTDVQNPKVRFIGANVNLTCDFAEGSTADGCFFNFTGYNTDLEPQSFFINRSGNSSVATTCDVADAPADDKNYEWSAFDDIGGVPITVELIPVGIWEEDNFTCQQGMQHMHKE